MVLRVARPPRRAQGCFTTTIAFEEAPNAYSFTPTKNEVRRTPVQAWRLMLGTRSGMCLVSGALVWARFSARR